MDIYDAIFGRRSIREFEDRAVDRAVLERIIEAATEAPSSHDAQPWCFHVATGRTRELIGQEMALSTVHLQEYLDSLPPDRTETAERFFATLGGAPVAIALSVPITPDDLMRINHYLSAGCALQNLQLAAYAEGIGCCNLTFGFWVRDKLAETLKVPEDREIISLVILGHPAGTPEAKPRRGGIVSYYD